MLIIGLTGWTKSGKTELSKSIPGWHSVAYADRLRDFIYALNPGLFDGSFVKDVIDFYGWDGYKNTIYKNEIRELIQRIGTECGRGILGEDIWINVLMSSLDENKNYIVHDVRFENEAQAIRSRAGRIVKITRPGCGPVNDHSSEKPIPEHLVDDVLNNEGTIEESSARLQQVIQSVWYT